MTIVQDIFRDTNCDSVALRLSMIFEKKYHHDRPACYHRQGYINMCSLNTMVWHSSNHVHLVVGVSSFANLYAF